MTSQTCVSYVFLMYVDSPIVGSSNCWSHSQSCSKSTRLCWRAASSSSSIPHLLYIYQMYTRVSLVYLYILTTLQSYTSNQSLFHFLTTLKFTLPLKKPVLCCDYLFGIIIVPAQPLQHLQPPDRVRSYLLPSAFACRVEAKQPFSAALNRHNNPPTRLSSQRRRNSAIDKNVSRTSENLNCLQLPISQRTTVVVIYFL